MLAVHVQLSDNLFSGEFPQLFGEDALLEGFFAAIYEVLTACAQPSRGLRDWCAPVRACLQALLHACHAATRLQKHICTLMRLPCAGYLADSSDNQGLVGQTPDFLAPGVSPVPGSKKLHMQGDLHG